MEDLSKELRQKYGIETPIESIEKVIEKMGGSVCVNEELTECKIESLSDGFMITIPSKQYMFSSFGRFMIVRKLGLYMKYHWHPNDVKENSFVDEVWASEFAMRFLVPADSLLKLLEDKWADLNTSELAAYFNIPVIFYINRVALWKTRGI